MENAEGSKELEDADVDLNGMELAPELTENAKTVLRRRYLLKDGNAKVIETERELFTRVAKAVAAVDRIYEPDRKLRETEQEFYELMARMEFLPNSPTLMNAGREKGQLSACFVLPVEDSLDKIFETVKNAALIHQTGGGTGFSFSRLRPRNDVVRSTGGIASGPVSFVKVFNQATEVIKQGGTRRGANMAILSVRHPDILEFITCKRDNAEITNFNISVALDEDFMRAVEEDRSYKLINPNTNEAVKKLSARKVFDFIVNQAWLNGEPGIVFLDRINKDNPTPTLGEIEATNPCGEQPLLPYEACNLGSVNLSKCVTEDKEINWEKLRRIVRSGIHFLDNVIDASTFPLKEIDNLVKGNRKVGLGVMGWADMLYQLEVPYDSEEALALAERVIKFIRDEADQMSLELAGTRGTFPNWDKSVYVNTHLKFRNATRLTIAPTGTISLIAGASSGIEPAFALVFVRNVMEGVELTEVNPHFLATAKREGFYSEELLTEVSRSGSLREVQGIPERWKRIFVVSQDIPTEWHVRMQAAFQKYVDNAVSKTINLPKDATPDDVRRAYLSAYHSGCKGVTVYRYGSREGQVLNIGEVNKRQRVFPQQLNLVQPVLPGMRIKPRPRPPIVSGATTSIQTGCGKMYVTINEDDEGNPFEVFVQIGKAGGCAGAYSEALARLVSLCLRTGVAVESILKQLRGISCPFPQILPGGERVYSCPDAIAKAVEKYLEYKGKPVNKYTFPKKGDVPSSKTPSRSSASEDDLSLLDDEEVPTVATEGNEMTFTTFSDLFRSLVDVCPDCGGTLLHDSTCVYCRICGYSRC